MTFQGFLLKLAPQYDDCPRPCALTVDDERPRDLPDLCSTCDVRVQERFMRRSAERELARRFREGECRWSFEELYADVLRVMALAHRAKRNSYPRRVEVFDLALIDCVRREERRPERIRAWERSQKTSSSDE